MGWAQRDEENNDEKIEAYWEIQRIPYAMLKNRSMYQQKVIYRKIWSKRAAENSTREYGKWETVREIENRPPSKKAKNEQCA